MRYVWQGNRPRRGLVPRTLLALVALVLACPIPAHAEVRQARAADELVDSVGVNVHLHYAGTVYDTAFATVVKPKLLAAGIRHVRDGAYTYDAAGAQAPYYQRCRALAAAGIRFNLLTTIRTTSADPTDYAKLADVYRWCDGAVESFEGANEPDIQPIPAGAPDWKTQTVDAQKKLHAGVKGNPLIQHVSVLGPTVVWSPAAVGDLSPYLDYGNWHPYPGGECSTCGDAYGQTIDTFLPKYRQPSGGKPMIMTETGYHNAVQTTAGGHRPASELAAGKYIPRLLLEYFNRGFRRTYLYELLDAGPDATKANPDANFGLLRNDGTEKPAYRALRSLMTLMRDPGPTLTPGSLDYSITGDTGRLRQSLLQKRDGTFLLALWLEHSSYDTGARPNAADNVAARSDLVVPEKGVTLAVGTQSRPGTVHRFQDDGTFSSAPATLASGQVALNVSDRMTVIELPPLPKATPPAPVQDGQDPDSAPPEQGGESPAAPPAPRAPTPEAPTSRPPRPQAPRLEGVRLSRGVLVRHRARARSGSGAHTTALWLAYSLSEAATLEIAVERVLPRRPAGQAVRRVATVRVRAEAGRGSTRLSSRPIRRLRPGLYRARVSAVDGQGARSPERSTALRVLAR